MNPPTVQETLQSAIAHVEAHVLPGVAQLAAGEDVQATLVQAKEALADGNTHTMQAAIAGLARFGGYGVV